MKKNNNNPPIKIHPKAEVKILIEPDFVTFRHRGLLCCIQRMKHFGGNLNGYVAVERDHPFYGKKYHDHVIVEDINELPYNGAIIPAFIHAFSPEAGSNMVTIDLLMQVHGGLTYSSSQLAGVPDRVRATKTKPARLFKRWWFGFDTLHSGDLRPYLYQFDIDLNKIMKDKYPELSGVRDYEEYRDFQYVEAETKSLAEQLYQMVNSEAHHRQLDV